MSDRNDFQLFDNYEEDGQLSLFSADYDDWDEDWVEEDAPEGENGTVVAPEEKVQAGVKNEKSAKAAENTAKSVENTAKVVESTGPDIRVKYCACCGKLLFVREETAGFHSECNNCGIKYFQKL